MSCLLVKRLVEVVRIFLFVLRFEQCRTTKLVSVPHPRKTIITIIESLLTGLHFRACHSEEKPSQQKTNNCLAKRLTLLHGYFSVSSPYDISHVAVPSRLRCLVFRCSKANQRIRSVTPNADEIQYHSNGWRTEVRACLGQANKVPVKLLKERFL